MGDVTDVGRDRVSPGVKLSEPRPYPVTPQWVTRSVSL